MEIILETLILIIILLNIQMDISQRAYIEVYNKMEVFYLLSI
jgi:hypothetical protein